MQPTKTLPDHYNLDVTLDLTKNMRVLLGLNVAGLVLFLFFGAVFWRLFIGARPDFSLQPFRFGALEGLLVVVVVSILVVIVHELVHGLFFWIYLRERPIFGFRGAYAFAAAPDWYIPRPQFIVVGLAPLVLISGGGLLLLPLLPVGMLPALLFALTVNAAGAVGDLYVVAWLFTKPDTVLVNDEGDRFAMFLPGR